MKKLTFRSQFVTVALVLALALTGCATKPTYQTPSSGPKIITNAQGVPNYHLVTRGDTVSQIASRYRLNYRQIAALNGLDSQYTIYSGQMLKLWDGGRNQASNVGNSNNNASANPPYNSTPNTAYEETANATVGYEYPSRNQVVRNFDEAAGSMGMWFSGKEGDPVYASKAGTVLYAGNGLEEYGNLIMVRHSDNYITAYAHNSGLMVKEGDAVQGGQHIANMGRNGRTNEVGFEFQVRLNGNAIDPRAVLGR